MRHVTIAGINLIKKYEGFSATPYICPAGYKTIGYGHVILANENISGHFSYEEAEIILLADLNKFENSVLRLIKTPLSDGQFDALISFTFNLGAAALQRSALRRKINSGYSELDIAYEFMKWVYVKGKKFPGLINRRKEEANLYLM